MLETIGIRGEVNIVAIDSNGNRTTVYDGPNLVVDQGLSILAELAGQGTTAFSPELNRISAIRLGGSLTSSGDVQSATPTLPDQVDIQGTFIFDVVVGSVDYQAGSVLLHGTLNTTEGNGFKVMEAALMTGRDANTPRRMFARTVIPSAQWFDKIAATAFEFNWSIIFGGGSKTSTLKRRG